MKRQQPRQMSQRHTPTHAPHLAHVTLSVHKDPTCPSIVHRRSCMVRTAPRCLQESGKEPDDSVRVEHREELKRAHRAHCMACPVRARTQASIRKGGRVTAAARMCGKKHLNSPLVVEGEGSTTWAKEEVRTVPARTKSILSALSRSIARQLASLAAFTRLDVIDRA